MDIIDFTGIFDPVGRFITFGRYEVLCNTVVSFSEKTRREGLLSLEDDLESIENTMLKKLLQLVVDGTDPEIVRIIGEDMISSALHSLEEILACIEFTVSNACTDCFDSLFVHYMKSRDLGRHTGLAKDACTGLSSVITGTGDHEIPGGRYDDLVQMLKADFSDEIKYEMAADHIDSVLHVNSVYYDMVLTGALSIQAGDNPRILADRMRSIAGIHADDESGNGELLL